MKQLITATCLLLTLSISGCASNASFRSNASSYASDRDAIDFTLDDFHDAAANADFDRYFSHFARNGYFLGTDAAERWNLPTFKSYTKERFDTGVGWTYTPRSRQVIIDYSRNVAWFDELLDSPNYGTSRGTGVLSLDNLGIWRIEQYHLSFPIPNDIAQELTARIKEHEATSQ